MSVGQNIESILLKLNKSRYRLSKDSGISQSYINELIKGKYNNPSLNILNSLAKALNVPITDLLTDLLNETG